MQTYWFSVEELRPLAVWLMHQSLPYDNPALHDVVDKIVKFVEKNDELANRTSIPTQGS
jgi:hypothetical protein